VDPHVAYLWTEHQHRAAAQGLLTNGWMKPTVKPK
jgi:hypothetical protein